MSYMLFEKLETQIDQAVETIELLRMQVEELEAQNTQLKEKQQQWESMLNQMVEKLHSIQPNTTTNTSTPQPEYN